MQVIEAVTRSGVSISPAATLVDAANLMEQRGVGALVVVAEGVPVGFVTDRDLVRRATAHRLAPSARVDAVMTAPVVTIDASTDLRAATEALDAHAIRHLVVTRGDTFVGVVNVQDVQPMQVG